MHFIIDFFLNLVSGMGYTGVFLLMAVESSFIPFPSEIVVPPAAFLAAKGEMSLFLVVLASVLGSLVGASVNYFLSKSLGRKIVYSLLKTRIAKWCFMDTEKMKKAEKYFLTHGGKSTFIGRLIPGIRQLVSIPAGFTSMNYPKFLFYTFLGSSVWVIILALLGYYASSSIDFFLSYYNYFIFALIACVLVFFVVLTFRRRAKLNKKNK